MAHIESPVTVSRRAPAPVGGEPTPTVVWLRGEHDIATRVRISVTIAQAARRDDGDIVVDLSGVTFMDASTIGVIVVSRDHLRARARSLSVRLPSPRALRLLDLCGLAALIDQPPPALSPAAAASRALGTWVNVPPTARQQEPDAARPAGATAPSQLLRSSGQQGAKPRSLLEPDPSPRS